MVAPSPEYAFGIGPKSSIGDSLTSVLEGANLADSLVAAAKAGNVSDFIKDFDDAAGIVADGAQVINTATGKVNELTGDVEKFLDTFGDFPFMSQRTGLVSNLDRCSAKEPDECRPPEVVIFGGRGEGARATAIVGKNVKTKDGRTSKDIQGGVVAVKVDDGGEGYIYPPFVEIRDNCGLGIGCHARAVLRGGKVRRIYIVTPGEGYPGGGDEIFIPEEVEIIEGGGGYTPGIVEDEFGNDYEIITDPGGTVVEIKPITIIPVDDIPTIRIPTINPPIPPGGIKRPVPDPNNPDGPPQFIIEDEVGNPIPPIGPPQIPGTPSTPGVGGTSPDGIPFAVIGSGLKYRVILTALPTSKDVLDGNISDELKERFQQEEIQEIIDCIED